MLLALQAAGTHAKRLQEALQKILLLLRTRWGVKQKLPPLSGKRKQDRVDGVIDSVLPISYTPRPHASITIEGHRLQALLDTGSEVTCLDTTTANLLRRPENSFSTRQEIRMADGTTVNTNEVLRLPINLGNRTITHDCRVVPTLTCAMIIGMDLWGKTRLPLLPPPSPRNDAAHVCSISEGMTPRTPSEEHQLQRFLDTELALFERIRGPTHAAYHHIRLKNPRPIKQRYRPRNPAMQQIIDEAVNQMLQEKVIEPSRSAWSSPVVIVKKKDGRPRFCIDFRKLNEVTEKDAYPLPHIAATLDKLRGARYLSTIDLQSGYWQIPLSPTSRPLTAFTVPGRGLFQFRVMPFGLHSAPATFQRLLDTVLGPELEPYVLVYLDDIIVISHTFQEHIHRLTEVFRRLREARLKPNPEKCRFCVDQLKYLGHLVTRDGIRTDPAKISAITEWPIPTTTRKVRQFLGLASWYRRFIPDFSTLVAPLTRLTKKNIKWQWGETEQATFSQIKNRLISAPVLACPDFTRPFTLQTDASKEGLGIVLSQHTETGEHVIAYASRTLNPAERNYSATELECLAVVWGIRRMRDYLEGYFFTVVTDHQSLRWLRSIEAPTGRLGRWVCELQQHNFEIKYRKGTLNIVADALSRQPEVNQMQIEPQCSWYRKIMDGVRQKPTEWPDYTIRQGILHRHILHELDFKEIDPAEQWKQCVPREQRLAILRQFHDAPTAGHLGTAKTITRVAQRYYWPGMFREISRYVQSCPKCLAHKASQQKPAGVLHPTAVKRPWQQVTIDLIGPLPRSSQGHTWLLTMQDRFTKWLEMRPLRRATAPAVTRAIAHEIIYRHGCPNTIMSDNGTQLKSRQLAQLLTEFGITHRTAPIHAPHCNPVERANRTIKTMIAQYIERDHRKWDDHIPALQFAFNSAKQESTGYSPAYLDTGREPDPPHAVKPPRTDLAPDPATHRQQIEEAYEVVRINLARAFQQQARYYDLRRRAWRPRLGDTVWKKEYPLSNKERAFNAKLAPKYAGPMIVKRIISPVIVDLRDQHGRWYRHIHIQDLKTNNTDQPHDEVSAITAGYKSARNAPTGQKQLNHAMELSKRFAVADLDQLWTDLLLSDDDDDDTRGKPGPTPETTARTSVPAIGTRIQRSDREQAGKKAIFLTAPPPPPPPRGWRKKSPRPTQVAAIHGPLRTRTPAGTPTPAPSPAPPPPATTSRPKKATGPTPAAPISVEVEPGHIELVPFFAAHVSRRYTIRAANGRWMARFDNRGKLRSCRRLPDRNPPQEGGRCNETS